MDVVGCFQVVHVVQFVLDCRQLSRLCFGCCSVAQRILINLSSACFTLFWVVHSVFMSCFCRLLYVGLVSSKLIQFVSVRFISFQVVLHSL